MLLQVRKTDKNFTNAIAYNNLLSEIKSFLRTIKDNKGIFITTADFTKEARNEAKPYRGRVALINKNDLIKYCKKYQIKCVKQTIDIFKLIEN